MERHIGQKVCRNGGRTKGPPKRTKEDNVRFETALEPILWNTAVSIGDIQWLCIKFMKFNY